MKTFLLSFLLLAAPCEAVNGLGLCDFDCDDDSDCNEGLLCADKHKDELIESGYDKRKANCDPKSSGAWNEEVCFDPSILKLGECEVDCDTDDDCQGGLLCADQHGDELLDAGMDKRKAYCGPVGEWNEEVCYIPNLPVSDWRQIGNDLEGTQPYGHFGKVSCSDDGYVVAVGAHTMRDEMEMTTGMVSVFRYSQTQDAWIRIGQSIYGYGDDDNFGWAIDLSGTGNVLAVGAWEGGNDHDGPGMKAPGYAQVFLYDAVQDRWNQIGADFFGGNPGDRHGYSIALSQDGFTVAVGAPYYSSSRGLVQIFKYIPEFGNWTQIGNDINGRNNLGSDISMSSDGHTVAISSRDYPKTTDVQVYKYDTQDDEWIQVGDDIPGVYPYHNSPPEVDISGDGSLVVIGLEKFDFEDLAHKGIVRVFEFDGKNWNQKGQMIESENSLGRDVSISRDGNIMAAGSYGSGPDGYARVYKFDQSYGKWIQITSDFEQPHFSSLDLSSSGSIVAFGASQFSVDFEDTYTQPGGRVQVFASISG